MDIISKMVSKPVLVKEDLLGGGGDKRDVIAPWKGEKSINGRYGWL
jgi:hypothetical protein